MNNKYLIVIIIGLVVGLGLTSTKAVEAYRGDPNVQGPNYSTERHEAMLKAFANNDYNAWKNLMQGRGATRVINAQNFARFAEAHKLALAGKTAEANKIRQELGLGNGGGMGFGKVGR